MTISQNPESYMFEGAVFGALTDSKGTPISDWSRVANCQKFALKPNAETKENLGNDRNNFGMPIASVVNKQPADLSCAFNQLSPLLKSLLFMGESSEIVQASGSETDKAFTAPAPGKILPLGKYSVSNVVITSKTINTDYKVIDPQSGLILIVEGGGITEDEALTISFDYDGMTIEQTTTGTKIGQYIRLLVSATNKVTGEHAEYDLYCVQLVTNSEFDIFGSEFQTVEFTGKPIVPEGSTTGIGTFREPRKTA